MKELVIILMVVFVIFIVAFSIVFTKQNKKKNVSLMNLFLSYDKTKQIKISMLKNDLMNSCELMNELDALELAIKLESGGWRKEVKIDSVEVYL